jgi:hypothetical protein
MTGQQSIPHQRRRPTFGQEVLNRSEHLSRPELSELVSYYSQFTPYFSLQILLKYSNVHPATVLERYGSKAGPIHVWRSTSDPNIAVVSAGVAGDSACVVAIQPSGVDHTWSLLTDAKPSSAGFSRDLEPLLQKLNPLLVGGWVSTHQLLFVLRELEKATHCAVRPSRVASRARRRSTVDWLAASDLASVESELSHKRAYLQSLAFSLTEGERPRTVLKAAVNRAYRVTFKSGSYDVLKRHLVDRLAVLLAEQVEGTDPAALDLIPNTELRFSFEKDQLGDRASHERLRDVIGQLPRLSVSASHINPYLQLSVVDYEDGSTMDVFSDRPTQVVFIPGPRCSGASILRVSHQIYSEFASGKLQRLSPQADRPAMGFASD